ncbi:MAG: hypothetical protein KJN67_04915, partial [Pontiella sp.]|nr:hypothetical protein [Pontiella sp.]
YSTALADQLVSELETCASLAFSLNNRARNVHDLVRRAARSLFPVQIEEVGLPPALNELAAFAEETKPVKVALHTCGNLNDIPSATALEFYRIGQETIFFILNTTNSKNISVDVGLSASILCLEITHDGNAVESLLPQSQEARLLEYRLKQIHGKLHFIKSKVTESLRFEAPFNPRLSHS